MHGRKMPQSDRGVVVHSGLRSERIRIPRGGDISGRQGGIASADLLEKLLSLTSRHIRYEYSAVSRSCCCNVHGTAYLLV